MAISFEDILQASARLETEDGDDVVGVFQMQYRDVGSISDQQGIDDVIEFLEDVYAVIRLLVPLLSLFRDITVRNITQSVNYGAFPWPTIVSGAGAGNSLPPGVSAMTSFPTGVSSVVLRKYWGSIVVGNVTLPGLLTAGCVTTQTTAAAILLVPFLSAGGRTWHYGYNSPKTLSFIRPTAAVITDVPAYQRRRRQGRGS